MELFAKWQDEFLIYAKYCSELPDAQEFLDRKIKQDNGFSQKLEVNISIDQTMKISFILFSNAVKRQVNLVNFNYVILLFSRFNVLLNILSYYM